MADELKWSLITLALTLGSFWLPGGRVLVLPFFLVLVLILIFWSARRSAEREEEEEAQ